MFDLEATKFDEIEVRLFTVLSSLFEIAPRSPRALAIFDSAASIASIEVFAPALVETSAVPIFVMEEVSVTLPAELHTDSRMYVFGNLKTGRPYQNLYRSWNKARCDAGLHDFRLHDLRHSFASILVNNGVSIYEVQNLLGHASINTTKRYAHLAPETLRKSAQVAADVYSLAKLEGVNTLAEDIAQTL
mgnify:CR=1 FL=1